MKPNVALTLREEAVVQARQTIERRVNELGVAEPSIAQQGANGDQILVQLPGVTDVNRAKEIIRSTGLLELKIVEQGPSASKEALLANGTVPAGMEVVPGVSSGVGCRRRHRLLPGAQGGRRDRPRSAQRASVARREQPPGRRLHAQLGRGGEVRQGHRRATSAASLAIILDGRVQSAPRIDSRITSDGRISGSFTQEEVQNLSLILRSGSLPATLDLSRGAHDRPEPRRRFDPLGRHRVDRRPGADHRVHADLLQGGQA